jgi:hypothetical protein
MGTAAGVDGAFAVKPRRSRQTVDNPHLVRTDPIAPGLRLLTYPAGEHSRGLVVAMKPGLVLRPQVVGSDARWLAALRDNDGVIRNRTDSRRVRRSAGHERPVVIADPQPNSQLPVAHWVRGPIPQPAAGRADDPADVAQPGPSSSRPRPWCVGTCRWCRVGVGHCRSSVCTNHGHIDGLHTGTLWNSCSERSATSHESVASHRNMLALNSIEQL